MGCGGRIILTSDNSESVIESPNRPSATPPNIECEWVILAPAGNSIQLDFIGQLDIIGSYSYCRQAGVQIRDGGTLSASMIGRYCGNTAPGSIYSRGNSMHVRYFNTVQNPGTGFQARISIGMHIISVYNFVIIVQFKLFSINLQLDVEAL